MSRATQEMRDLSRCLITYETKNKSSETIPSGSFHVCEKLRPHLATLMGNEGFRALLSRALALANVEVPWLGTVHVKADGSMEGLNEIKAQVEPEDIAEGSVVVFAQLLGLLVAFIGETLTLRMVREVWPKLPQINELDLRKGDKK